MNTRLTTILFLCFIAIALHSPAAPPPEKKDMTMTELTSQLFNLDGKVVECEITRASSFDQIAKGKYSVYLYFYKGNGSYNGERVLIPEDGRDFIEEMAERNYGNWSTETIYLLVHSEKPLEVKGGDYTRTFKLEALGTRFRKSKGTYSW